MSALARGRAHNVDTEAPCTHRSLCFLLPIIHPNQTFAMVWDFFIILILILSSILIPFVLSFSIPDRYHRLEKSVLLFMDIFLCLDILITFRTAIYDEYDPLILITCPITIAKQYLRFWFFFDLITSFPFDFIIGQHSEGFAQYVTILRLIRFIRIFRIVRVLRYINLSHARFKFSPAFIYRLEICKIMFAMAFMAHLFACLWYAVGIFYTERGLTTWITEQGLDDPAISIGVRYSTSMYWSVITLFTTGYGDITANNTAEQWVCIFCVGVGSCVSAWFIGTFSVLVLEGSKENVLKREAVEKALVFCNHFKFDDELQRAIVSHTKYYYHYNYVAGSKDEVMNCLPLYLQNKIKRQLARRTLIQSEFFKTLPRQVIGHLVLKSKSVACNAGYCLFEKNENASELYVCTNGECTLTHAREEKQYIVKRGDMVGEYCLAEDKRRYTLICNTWSEFWVITKQDIYDCIESYYGKEKAMAKWTELVAKLSGKRKRRKLSLANDEHFDLEYDTSMVHQLSSRHLPSLDISDTIHASKHDGKEEEENEVKHTDITELVAYNGQQAHIDSSNDERSVSNEMKQNSSFEPTKPNKMPTFLKIFKRKKKKIKHKTVKKNSPKMNNTDHSYRQATQQSDSNSDTDQEDGNHGIPLHTNETIEHERNISNDPCTDPQTQRIIDKKT
eukprot:553824_1